MEELTVTGHLSPSLRLEIDSSNQLARLLSRFKDKHLEITITIFRRKRSLAQNRWIWGVCIPTVLGWLKDTQGVRYTKEEVYAFIQQNVLGHKFILREIDGEEVLVLDGKALKNMTTKEFSEAVEEIVEYYALRGLVIELPKPDSNNVITDFLKDD